MDISKIPVGTMLGMDIGAMEKQLEEEVPLREDGRQLLASRAANLSHTAVAAVVEGVLIEALNQFINTHKLDSLEAGGLLSCVLRDAEFHFSEEQYEVRQAHSEED